MIKFLVMDVDGTLTDGKIYMGVDGECFKAFDIKDGYALHTIIKEYGIVPVIITARNSPMVEHRCKELGVVEIHQGVLAKLDCLRTILLKYSNDEQHYSLANCAYIGDDILDLHCMKPIKEAGGIVGCPADAVQSVRNACDYVSSNKAGEGAVRDFIEYIIANRNRISNQANLKERLDDVIEYISNLDFKNLKVGRYEVSPDFYYAVQEYMAFEEGESQYESHRKYIDIQWVYEGKEKLLVTDINGLFPSDSYDAEKDVIHYYNTSNLTASYLTPGCCCVLFPKDAHKPGRFQGEKCIVKKVVGKLRIL